jgi:hypothetical protein
LVVIYKQWEQRHAEIYHGYFTKIPVIKNSP